MKKITAFSKTNISIVSIICAIAFLSSCASGKYYKAGEDYKNHSERYYKDDRQTMNDPYFRYSQSKPIQQESRKGQSKRRR